MSMEEQDKRPLPRWVIVAAALAALAGAYLRLSQLGDSALRADTITFFKICQQDLSALDIFRHWLELGHVNQLPFANAFAKWLIDVLGVPVTHFSVRLPSALWGMLCLVAGFFVGKELAGYWGAVVMTWAVALNPYHIQMSREAYFYAPMLLGAFLVLWAILRVVRYVAGAALLSRPSYAVLAVGFLLVTYAHPSGWSVTVFVLLFLIGLLAWRVKRAGGWDMRLVAMLALCVILLAPLFFVSWGIPQVMENITGAVKDAGEARLSETRIRLGDMLLSVATSFAWGGTALRASVSVLVLLVGILNAVKNTRRHLYRLLPLCMVVAVMALFLVGQRAQATNFSTRYVVAMLPAYLALLVLGLFYVMAFCRDRWPERERLWALLVCGAAVALWARPAYLAARLDGKPTPYKKIVDWMDSNLPRGSLVLVDRWYEPWNELRVHASTNVYFTFTVPNEPLEAYKANRWRDTAKDFFERHPGAAYLEITKAYQEVPEIGPWRWPRTYFAQNRTFVNEAGLALRHLGLAAREDFYAANTNRVVVELFYNKREDLLARARREGESARAFYGEGWGYTKTEDYRDWRVLRQAAVLDVYNTRTEPLDVQLSITGVAVQGAKEVVFGEGVNHTFPAGELTRVQVGPVRLNPGLNRLRVYDSRYTATRAVLLVSEVDVQAVSGAVPSTSNAGG